MPPDHPYDRLVNALGDRGCLVGRGCRVTPERTRAKCPTHSDARPSLVVTRRDDKVLIRCFAGCRVGDVVSALGLRMADLFAGHSRPTERPGIAATYDYIDVDGVLVAQKVRFTNKSFRWRTPGRDVDTWRWGLHGGSPGLYRIPELARVHRVFLNEGEKATDYLWTLGLAATCPPAGASTWHDAWCRDLLNVGCRELVILADNDRAGETFATKVASSAYRHHPLAAKIVRLPGLQTAADAFDWLTEGHTAADLQNAALAVSYWDPDLVAQERLDRRRALTRERVHRHRAQRRAESSCNAVNVSDCNGVNVQRPDVTRNAVTQGERSSVHVTKTFPLGTHSDIHRVTSEEVSRTGEDRGAGM